MKHSLLLLEVGDWSKDGHSQSDVFYVKSNLDTSDLKKAYLIGAEKFGVDLINEYCINYEDRAVPLDLAKSLRKLAKRLRTFKKLFKHDIKIAKLYNLNDVEVTEYEWVRAYLLICKLGNPNLEFKIVDREDGPWIDVGGYGLYCS